MRRSLFFLPAACLLGTLSAIAQTVSQLPPAAPFRIEPGTSFSASTEKRPVIEREAVKRSPEAERIIGDFSSALDVIRRHHVGGSNLETKSMTTASINGMLAELDPHSSYYDANEFRALLGEQDSEYSGTGSTISNFIENGRIETYVIATHRGSPAAHANLRYGDRIVSVDGIAVSGATIDIVRDRVRGPRGTTVRMVVERADGKGMETLELRRERVVQPSIPDFFMLRDGTGYIDLSDGFSHTTSAELETALDDLARRGMRSLVLDLRENTGGILDEAVRVAEKFLPAGRTIISQRGRNTFDNLTWKSENREPLNLPLVVLVNERTASASEVVAGALQDNDRALILGRNTFGKSLVQTVVGLPEGSGLTLTTARYYTPSGRSVQRSYANSGLYDYFNHRQPTANKSARTITNRPVFGGSGITPDEISGTEEFNLERASLIDPIFFFVRDVVNGKIAMPEGGLTGRPEQAAKSMAVDRVEVEKAYFALFRSYASRPNWKVSAHTLESEVTFVAEQLRYHLALASLGPKAAGRLRIEADPQIAKAIAALPRAAALSESARRITSPSTTKKPAGSHSQAGQGRNRRN